MAPQHQAAGGGGGGSGTSTNAAPLVAAGRWGRLMQRKIDWSAWPRYQFIIYNERSDPTTIEGGKNNCYHMYISEVASAFFLIAKAEYLSHFYIAVTLSSSLDVLYSIVFGKQSLVWLVYRISSVITFLVFWRALLLSKPYIL